MSFANVLDLSQKMLSAVSRSLKQFGEANHNLPKAIITYSSFRIGKREVMRLEL